MTENEPMFLMEDGKLPSLAAGVARRLKPHGRGGTAELARQLRAALRRIDRRAGRGDEGDQVAVWLLDNRYLARREALATLETLRHAGPQRLCTAGALLPAVCRELVRVCGGELTAGRLSRYLTGFQTVTPLCRAELLLVPDACKWALLVELGELCAADTAEPEALRRIFASLRLLAVMDLSRVLDGVDLTEGLLRSDPAGVYPRMDDATRELYRQQVARLAARHGCTEQSAARRALALAAEGRGREAHVGYWLFSRPLGDAEKARSGAGYMAANVLGSAGLSLLGGILTGSVAAGLLLLLPVSELVQRGVGAAVRRLVPPRPIPRMALAGGVPAEGRTVCCLSALLTSPDSARELSARLEEARLLSRECGENLVFGILADLPESPERTMPADDGALEAATAAISGLNEKYGGGFYLFCRRRSFDAASGRWAGRERKRGALLALARLLLGEKSDLCVMAGDGARLKGTRYILTLDADTHLLPGTARELIGAMLHPLNAPVMDEKHLAVREGYGLIHPRMDTLLAASGGSRFARLFSPRGGCDPYGCACGEAIFDLTGRGGFAGKGILDAAALLRCTAKLPEGRILSHDAVEGALLRGGYLSCAALSDGFSASPLSYWKRAQRWIRGDWQNAPFLFSRRLHPMDKWRLLDSLRRSLVPVGELSALLSAFVLPFSGTAAAAWASLAALFYPVLPAALRTLRRRGRVHLHGGTLHGVTGELCRGLARLTLLPADAWVSVSAVAQSLWRMCVTKKNLLRWQTCAQSETDTGRGWGAYLRALWPAVLCGGLSLLSPVAAGRAAGLLWLLSPGLGPALGRGAATPPPVSAAERSYLTDHGAKIWGYFRDFCTAESHFLPPDNVQLRPPLGAAGRTSPTNIGLGLTACLAALDLGLAPRETALTLAERMLCTVETLPKWRGHLYNWYDTGTLAVLDGGYVSTVDSGNLAACLLTCREGFARYGAAFLSRRAGALLDAMDFAPLYDSSRHLFHIGWDGRTKKLTQGWYDLMSSEARLMSYFAVARGDVPCRHWRQLSRAAARTCGYRCMVSWTGTVFEYLMPELFLPLCPDSLLWETARACLRAQRAHAPRGRPWGRSESAFHAFTPDGSYHYKAHGCAALALKRGMDGEDVVAPYASFLALAAESDAALRNLRALDAVASGPYGLYEAVDYAPGRGGAQGAVVGCYMAHHMGMSLVSIANRLCGGVIQRRFMADEAMRAYRCLLEEKAPLCSHAPSLSRRELPVRQRPEIAVARPESPDAAAAQPRLPHSGCGCFENL